MSDASLAQEGAPPKPAKEKAGKGKARKDRGDPPAFDLDDPVLPRWIATAALGSGGYPYDKSLKEKDYAPLLRDLQIELVKLQFHMQKTGMRVVCLFEGRDAAGKGGAIGAVREYMNPRNARIVALPKPDDTERGQWYFQRYVRHMPTRGEMVLFDRSWYNRGGVERVMGFASPMEVDHFLHEAPRFEAMLAEEGIHIFKFFLEIGQEMQMKRFHERRHDPLKIWKLSDMDRKALGLWEAYTEARDRMIEVTHTDGAPWTVVRGNDKRRARLALIAHLLTQLDYEGKDRKAIGAVDPRILGQGPGFLASQP